MSRESDNTNHLIHKSKDLVECRYSLNINSAKVFDLAVSKINPRSKVLNNPYRISVSEYADLQGITKQAGEREVFNSIKKLRETTVFKNDPNVGVVRGFGLIQKFDFYYSTEKKGSIVDVWFEDELSQDLLAQSAYSEKRIGTAFRIKGKWTYKLYEIINQWVGSGKCYYNYKELREILGVPPTSYTQPSSFILRVLSPSIKEINDITDIDCHFDVHYVKEERGDGKKSKKIPARVEFFGIKKGRPKEVGEVSRKKGRKRHEPPTPPLSDFIEDTYSKDLQKTLVRLGVQHLSKYKEDGFLEEHWLEALKEEGDGVLPHHLVTTVKRIKNLFNRQEKDRLLEEELEEIALTNKGWLNGEEMKFKKKLIRYSKIGVWRKLPDESVVLFKDPKFIEKLLPSFESTVL